MHRCPPSWPVSPRALLAHLGQPRPRPRTADLWRPPEELEPRRLLATILWDGGPSGLGTDFHLAANWDGDVLPGSSDDAVISVAANPTITITSTTTVNSITSDEAITQTAETLTLNAGSVFNAPYSLTGNMTGSGSLTFNAGLAWSGGIMYGSGLVIIPAGQTLAISNTVTLGQPLDNFGTISWTGGTFNFAGATLTNKVGALFIHGSINNVNSTGPCVFVNEGVYTKTAPGVREFAVQSFTNAASGAMNINAGTLLLSNTNFGTNLGVMAVGVGATLSISQNFTHAAGSSITGAGTLTFANVTQSISGATLWSAAVTFSTGTITGSGDLTFGGATTWSGGTLTGSGQTIIGASGSLTLSGSRTTDRPLTVNGTLNTASTTFTLNAAGQFNSLLALAGGTLAGSGNVTFSGGLTWSGGTLAGTGRVIIPVGATVARTDGNLARPLDNFGTFNFGGSSSLVLNNGAEFNNKPGAIFNHSSSSGNLHAESGTPKVFTNEGAYNKNASGAQSFIFGLSFINTAAGIININAGTLSWAADGPHANNGQIVTLIGTSIAFSQTVAHGAGSSITGPAALTFANGAHAFTDQLQVSGPLSMSSGTVTFNQTRSFTQVFTVSGGILTGSGDLTFDAGLIWTNGTLAGPGRVIIPAGQAVSCTGGNLQRNLDNFGTFNFGGGSSLIFDSGAILTNKPGGILNHSANANLHAASAGAQEAFINEGVYNKTGANTAGFVFGLAVTNAAAGVMNINAGTLTWAGDSANHTNSGQIVTVGGTAIVFNQAVTHSAGSSITGSASVTFAAGAHTFTDQLQTTGPISISSGTVTFNQTRSFSQSVSFSGGSLAGTGDLTFTAGLTWSNGTLAGSGLSIIPAGQTLGYTGGGLHRSINNFGTFNFGGSASLIFDSGAVLTNKPGGILNHNATGNLHAASGGPVEAFINEGVYNKNVSGSFGFIFGLAVTNAAGGVMNVNAGTLDWQGETTGHSNAGQIDLDPGTTLNLARALTHSSGSSITGAGMLTLANLTQTISGPTLWSVPLTFSTGTITGPGDLTLSGAVTWSGGSFTGAGSVMFAAGPTINISGGTRTSDRDLVFVRSATISNGTITGAGDLTFNGGLTLGDFSTISGTGLAIFGSGQTVTLTGFDPKIISRNAENFGTFNLPGSAVGLTINSATFTNRAGGQFNHATTVELTGNGAFVNEGVYTKSSSAILPIPSFTNAASGVLNVTAGTLTIQTTNPFVNLGVVSLSLGTTLRFQVPATHGVGSSITGAGAVLFMGGASQTFTDQLQNTGPITINSTLTFNQTRSFSQLVTLNGTITGAGDLTFNGGLTLGDFSTISGTGLAIFGSGQTVTLTGFDPKIISRNAENFGIFNMPGSAVALTINNATFTNRAGGQFNHATTVELAGSGSGAFVNEGVYSKSSSAILAIPSFTNAISGVLNVTAGTLTIQTTNPFSNLGTLSIGSSAAATFGQLHDQLSASTLTGGTWIVAGTLTFPSGTALTTIGAAATVTLDGPSAAINASGGGSTLTGLATNAGSLTLKNAAPWGFITTGTFNNSGTFSTAGTGTLTVPAAVTFNNTGTLDIGSDLRGPGGGGDFNGPIVGGGIINIRATLTIDADSTFEGQVNHFPTGTRNGAAIWTVNGTYNWFGGTMDGTGRTLVGSTNTLNMVSGVMLLSGGHALENLDEGIWTGGCLAMNAGTFINSPGANFSITGPTEVLSEGGVNAFVNEGDLILTDDADTDFGSGIAYSNSGSVTYDAAVSFESDQVFDSLVVITANGLISGPGNLTFNADLDWQGGGFFGPGFVTVAPGGLLSMSGEDDKLLDTTFNHDAVGGIWTGGCLNMGSLFAIFNNGPGATLDIFADPMIDVNGPPTAQFNNAGLITVHTGEFVIHVGGTNSGTIIVIPPDTLIFTVTYTHAPGSMLAGPGGVAFLGGIHTFASGTFTVEGPVTLGPGASLTLPAASLPNYNASTHTFSGGDWSIGDGALLNLSGAEIWTIDANTSFTLSGNAIFTALNTLSTINGSLTLTGGRDLAVNPADPITAGSLVSNGAITLDPGSTLSTSGGYTQTSGASLNVRFSGNDAATMGVLSTGGLTSLAGHLDIAYAFNYTPPVYTNHRFLVTNIHSSLTGAFATTSIPIPGTDLKAPLLTDPKGMRLLVSSIADWNNDADVGVPDIFAFLASWFAGNADINNDGSTNVPDIFAFLSRWFAAP